MLDPGKLGLGGKGQVENEGRKREYKRAGVYVVLRGGLLLVQACLQPEVPLYHPTYTRGFFNHPCF